jgi:hypothetical protein
MLRKTTFATVLVLVSAALWACGGDDSVQPLAPSSSAATAPARTGVGPAATANNKDVIGTLLGALGLGGQPQLFVCQGNGGPYKGSATVGILGGQVKIGPHTLTVPPLAVLKPVTITATTIPGDTIGVVFGPQGQKFLLPPTLSLDYSHCKNQPDQPLAIDLLDDLLGTVLDLLPSLDKGAGKVTAPIWHFSVYAAAETRSGGRGH